MIARVPDKTGAMVQSRGMMYKAVTQSVLLYVSDIRVVTGNILKVLEGFHNQEAMRTKGMTEICGAGGEWEYPPMVAAI